MNQNQNQTQNQKSTNTLYRRRSISGQTSSSTRMKKSIDYAQPSVLNFINMCFIFIFKRFVFAPSHIKIGIYTIALFICSIIRDFNILPHTNYFSQKHNIFNLYFVKLGWAWTLFASLLCPNDLSCLHRI